MHNIVFLSRPCFHTGRQGFPVKFSPFNMAAVNYFYLQLLAHTNKRMLDPVFFEISGAVLINTNELENNDILLS